MKINFGNPRSPARSGKRRLVELGIKKGQSGFVLNIYCLQNDMYVHTYVTYLLTYQANSSQLRAVLAVGHGLAVDPPTQLGSNL